MPTITRTVPVISMTLLGACLAHTAMAQESSTAPSTTSQSNQESSEPSPLQEVVVTATRRAQSIESVPISMQAFTESDMDTDSVRDMADIARMTPGVTFSNTDRGNTQGSDIVIRGISSGAGAATVGVYIDDTPIQIYPDSLSSTNSYPLIFDLQRVEILRGPQGTLFGAGSEGGTIRFITPDPSLTDYSTYSRGELSSIDHGDESYDSGFAVGGPIVQDVLGFRASVYYQRQGGYVDRINWYSQQLETQDANWNDSLSLRLATKWVPVENLSIEPSVFFQRTHIADSSIYWEAYSDPANGIFNNANPVVSPTNDDFTLPALRVSWQGETVSVFSNTSYFNRNNDNIYDSTTLDMASFAGVSSPQPPAALQNVYSIGALTDNQRILTQELRLQNTDPNARLSWLFGVFYQHSTQATTYTVNDPFINQIIGYQYPGVTVQDIFGYGLYQGVYLLDSAGQLTNRELAGFANFDFRITSRLTFTAGVRVSDEHYNDASFGAGPVVSSNGNTQYTSERDTPVTPKYALSYKINPDDMVYASAAKGFRQGSTQGEVGSRCAGDLGALGLTNMEFSPTEIKPDSVWSYEIGTKDRFLGGHFGIDTSIYHIDWKDIQSSLILPTCNVPITANEGNARSQGFDLSLIYAPINALRLGLALGYADAQYTTTTRGAGGVPIQLSGQPLPIAPWTVSPQVDYDFAVLGRGSYFHVDYQYLSHNDTPLPDIPSVDPTLPRPPSSSNLDMRLGMLFGGLDLSIFGTNINNQYPEFGRYRDTEAAISTYRGYTVTPRTIGVTATYRY